MPMDAIEALLTTRAIRRFTDEPVSDEDIADCLRAAVQAPSGGNIQPYQFVVVRDAELKQRIGAVYLQAWQRYGAATEAAMGDRFPSEGARAAWRRNVAASDHLARNLADAPVLVSSVQRCDISSYRASSTHVSNWMSRRRSNRSATCSRYSSTADCSDWVSAQSHSISSLENV